MSANGFHEEETLGKAYDARLMKRLMTYIRPYRLIVVAAVLLLLIGTASTVGLVYVQKWAIDDVILVGDLSGLTNLVGLFLGVMLVGFVATYGQAILTMWLGQKVLHDIRHQVFTHLQRMHPGFYDKNPVGRLVTRVTNDVNVLNEMFSTGVVTVIGDIVMLALIVGAMLHTNWRLALWVFLILPALILATFFFRLRVRKIYREVRLKVARINAFLQEHITGIRIIQLFVQEEQVQAEFDEINVGLRNAHFRSVYYYAVFFPLVQIIGTVSLAILFIKGGAQIESFDLTWGELFAYIVLVQMFYRPIQDLSEKYNILQASMASSERIFSLLDSPAMIRDPVSPRSLPDFKGRVQVENLWFAYNDDNWVLEDVSFAVEPGQTLAIVGATGSGKSTLVSLLYRFYDYQKGRIAIDGVEINQLSISGLRNHLGLVLQDVYLFSGDFASNVRLRNTDITDRQVEDAIRRVGLDEYLSGQKDGIHTEIKERGATLSTGQKQLLSFARALAFDPDILILDEATSSVDTHTELLIQKALGELLKDRTSIIIAHRLSTIEKADNIVVLHKGRVREMGRHDDLLAQKGLYYRLYQMQYKKPKDVTPLDSKVTRG